LYKINNNLSVLYAYYNIGIIINPFSTLLRSYNLVCKIYSVVPMCTYRTFYKLNSIKSFGKQRCDSPVRGAGMVEQNGRINNTIKNQAP